MRILIFGGTGSLGKQLVEVLYKNHNLIICSRDEQKHFIMRNYYKEHQNIQFVIGDISDKDFVDEIICLYNPELVINCAAQKHVRLSDENVFRCVQTNIFGTQNTIMSCIKNKVPFYLLISTDKAVEPATIYGMTKAIGERLVINYSQLKTDTKLICTRYGNVLNSKGSLIELYQNISTQKDPVFPVTDIEMTRFFLTFKDAINLIIFALRDSGCNVLCDGFTKPEIFNIENGIIYIPKSKAIKIIDIANIFAKKYNGNVKIIGKHYSEKMFEYLSKDCCSMDNLMLINELEQFLIENKAL